MGYIYNSDSIIKLFNVMEKIYLKYNDILNVKYKTDEYYSLIGELMRLTKMEDDIILSLPKSTSVLLEMNDSIKNIYSTSDIYMYNFVLNRFDSIIYNLSSSYEMEQLIALTGDTILDSQYNINSIQEEVNFNYILRLNEVINKVKGINFKRKIRYIQLSNIFSFKKISDTFIMNNLCLQNGMIQFNIKEYTDDISQYNSFMYLKDSVVFELCEKSLMKNITLSKIYEHSFDDTLFLLNMLQFNSYLMDINDYDFISIRSDFYCDLEDNNIDNFIIDKLKSCFDREYNRRFSIEKNVPTKSLDESFVNNLFFLLKLEDCLYDKIIGCNFDQNDNYSVISSLLCFEQDLVSNLDINVDNVDTVLSIINNDLDFFIERNDLLKVKSITVRLGNLFDVFHKFDLVDGISEKNYNSIMHNHIVDCLKMYDGSLSTIKNYLFMYPCLTDDVILLNGNLSMIDRFSDELTSISLNNNVYDYMYDKNEIFLKLFFDIMDDLDRYSDIYLDEWKSIFDFKLCELSDIIDNVSMENLCKIKEEVSSISDTNIKNKILSLF